MLPGSASLVVALSVRPEPDFRDTRRLNGIRNAEFRRGGKRQRSGHPAGEDFRLKEQFGAV
jgi:hypothetical protein